jgi:hypothetical protein
MDIRFGVLEGGGIVAIVSRLELVIEISPVVSCTDAVVEETLLRRERGLRPSDSETEKRSEARLERRRSLGE